MTRAKDFCVWVVVAGNYSPPAVSSYQSAAISKNNNPEASNTHATERTTLTVLSQ